MNNLVNCTNECTQLIQQLCSQPEVSDKAAFDCAEKCVAIGVTDDLAIGGGFLGHSFVNMYGCERYFAPRPVESPVESQEPADDKFVTIFFAMALVIGIALVLPEAFIIGAIA